MKSRILFPHIFRFVGCCLLILFITVYGLAAFNDADLSNYIHVWVPCNWLDLKSVVFFGSECDNGYVKLDLTDECMMLALIFSLLFIAFSKVKVEDERVAEIRLSALQWGIYANYLFLAVCMILFFSFDFMNVTLFNFFTPLVIFIIRFYWLYKIQPWIEARKGGIAV